MGMAASQARLLTLTARIHDIEYKAQCIQNAKVMLSQLEDEAYQKFLEAQDGSNVITIKVPGKDEGMSVSGIVQYFGFGVYDSSGTPYVPANVLNAYNNAGGDVVKFAANLGVTDFDSMLYQNYEKLFNWIGTNGANALDQSYSTDPSWLSKAITAGWTLGGMTQIAIDGNGMSVNYNPFADFHYTVSTDQSEKQTAKASAEYENTLRKIDKKEKMYDMELSKIETERTALTKEYDSLKKVIEDNIERTFGIFS